MVPFPLRRRAASWWWDYLVVVAWLAVVFVAVGVPQLAGWVDLDRIWTQPATADVAITILTVLPFLAYLVFTEAGHRRATFGKRRSGLVVARSPVIHDRIAGTVVRACDGADCSGWDPVSSR